MSGAMVVACSQSNKRAVIFFHPTLLLGSRIRGRMHVGEAAVYDARYVRRMTMDTGSVAGTNS